MTDDPRPLDEFRDYLRVLARARFPRRLQRHVDPSDIVQQTLLEAHASAGAFRGATAAEQMAWLRRILARNLLDEIKRLGRRKRDVARERPLREALDRSSQNLAAWLPAAKGSTPSRRVRRAEETLRLAAALNELTPDQQEAVVQRHLEGRTLAEIAERMERSPNAVAGLVHRGLAALRTRLGDA